MSIILVVDDRANARKILGQLLGKAGHSVVEAEDEYVAIEHLRGNPVDLVLTKVRMKRYDSGMNLLRIVKRDHPEIPVILEELFAITTFGTISQAVQAMKEGAEDYVEGPCNTDELMTKIERALQRRRLVEETGFLHHELHPTGNFSGIVGRSKKLQDVLELVREAAKSDSTVLIRGENGTGKALIARSIHNNSPRCDRPFIRVECSAYAGDELERELFGHRGGTFTAAIQSRIGSFELANGGTIFLNEIGDISPIVQSKLLRVIEDKAFERIDCSKFVKVDVRIIAATSKSLEEAIQKGMFREDLYRKISGISIYLPPLRERKEDIPDLVEYFIRKFSGKVYNKIKYVSPKAMDLMINYNWRGNIRELESAIERALILADGDTILPEHLSLPMRAEANQATTKSGTLKQVEILKEKLIRETLKHVGWVRSKAAAILGVKRTTLNYKIAKYNISSPDAPIDEKLEIEASLVPQEEEKEVLPVSERFLETRVSEIFDKKGLSGCVRYFNSKGIFYAKDLLDFDFDSLYRVPGFGKKKVRKVKEIWNDFLQESKYLGMQEQGSTDNREHVDTGASSPSIGSRSLVVPADEVFQNHWNELLNNERGRVLRLRAQGLTLQEVGEIKKITRERVRQTEVGIMLKVRAFIERFSDYFDHKWRNKIFITLDDIRVLFNSEEDALSFAYALRNDVSWKFQFLEELDIFLINGSAEELRNKLRGIVENYLPSAFNLGDYASNIENLLKEHGLDFVTLDMLKRYLLRTGYKEYGKYLSRRRLTLGDMAKVVIKEHFPEGVKVNDPAFIEKFKRIAKEEFGFSKGEILDRYLSARISDTLVLCKRGTYTLPENISITRDLLSEIKKYIDSYPGNTIFFKDLFLRFKDKLIEESNIDNEYFLHGVLKFYYKDEYYFDRDSLSKGKEDSQNIHEVLEEYLWSMGRPVSKEEIRREYPGFTYIMLSNAVNLNPNILRWDDGYFAHKDVLRFNNEDIFSLKNMIDKELALNDGYTNIYLLYPHVREERHDFIARNNISGPVNLFFVLEYLFGKDYNFSNPHILAYRTRGRFTIKDLIYNYMKEKRKVRVSELADYMLQLRLNPNTAFNSLAKLRDKILYLSSEEVILKEDFSISEGELEAVREKINRAFKDKNYSILRKEDLGYFPYIGYSWNFYLLRSIIDNYLSDFKVVGEHREDSFGIIVKRDFPIEDCVEMVRYIIDEELNGNRIAPHGLEELLKEKGIFNKELYRKVLKGYGMGTQKDTQDSSNEGTRKD